MVRKKVHGTILKGEKVSVQDARADERLQKSVRERGEDSAVRDRDGTTAGDKGVQGEDTTAQDENGTAAQPQRSLRKRKREEGVISAAVELPDDRKVRRGWTEPKRESEARKIKEKREKKKKDGKPKVKESTFTDQPECLFQTTVPDESKKRSSDRKKTWNKKQTTVVHEFENNTKHPSYLRQEPIDKKKTREFDEERGWVDEDGNVVERLAETAKKVRTRRGGDKEDDPSQLEEQSSIKDEEDNETSSSGSSATLEDEEQEGDSVLEEQKVSSSPIATEENPTPSNGPSVSVTEPSPVTPHPLETLFKKPKPPTSDPSTKSTLEINTSFAFFNNDDAEDETEPAQIKRSLETPGLPALRRRGLPNLSIPVTPYNHRDMQWRSQRSAAPTPDTAAPGKGGFGDPFGLLADIRREREEDIEEEEDENENENDEDDVMQGIEQEEPAATAPIKAEPTPDGKESDFSKWFWENRGANTRAWKKRKRDAAKEQRTRENRKRTA